MLSEIDVEDAHLVACSVDQLEQARGTVEKLGLTFEVGYGLNYEEVSKKTGAFYQPDKKYLHATGFLLNPDNTILNAVYSTGPIGRFVAKDVLAIIKYYKKNR